MTSPPGAIGDVPAQRRAALVRMQRVALCLLALAALLYCVATALQPRHPAWGYLAAFGEAAMVGAVADWFAVTALFRRPLSLPIPHTAIIPANKARIGRQLADFICGNFLATEAVLQRLRGFGPASKLAAWLASPVHADAVAGHLLKAAGFGLSALDDERVRRFVVNGVLTRLQHIDIAPLAGRLLAALTADRRHQALLDGALHQLSHVLADETVHAKIADSIAVEVRFLSVVGLDNVAGRVAARKVVAAVARLIGEMGDDPAHPLRLRFDDVMADFVDRLQHDPAFAARAEALKAELLAQPALAAQLHGLWGALLAWMHDDIGRLDSSLRQRIVAMALGAGVQLQQNEALRQWIDGQLLGAAPRWIGHYREDIRRTIVDRVDRWDADALTDELEQHIGRDLQFVRINGTLVGGLVGLTIHAVTLWVGTL